MPSLCLRCAFAIPPFQVRFRSASKPFVGNGGGWDLLGIYMGFAREAGGKKGTAS